MQSNPWCVLQVLTNHEKRVAQHLTVRSLEHYLPLYTERSRWTDRTVTLQRPLFPGYLFVRYATGSRIALVSTPGVLKLLGNETIDTISAAEIDRIRTALAEGYILRPHSNVSVGMRVRVTRGVFEGTEGIVTELRRKCTVVITLDAVEQCYSLEANLDDIEVLRTSASSTQQQPGPSFRSEAMAQARRALGLEAY
jgi:transcription antitermination factor NusG